MVKSGIMGRVYAYFGISKQTHHQALAQARHEAAKTAVVIGLLLCIREIHPGMGLRKMYELSDPSGTAGVGRDAFIAIGMEHGFRLEQKIANTRTTFSIKSNRFRNLLQDKVFTDINQLWTSDITYFSFQGQFYYIVLIMDVYSRRIIGYSIADNMRAEHTVTALKMALKTRKIKDFQQTLIHHSDRGSQYVSDVYTNLLEVHSIQISMCNEVYENTHIERANGTIKNEYLHRKIIETPKALAKALDQTIWAYNTERPHNSLGKGLSPVAFEKNILQIPIEQRVKLSIYIGEHSIKQNNAFYQTNQLNFNF